MEPKFSCADFTFPLLPHGKVLDLLKLLDFEAVDLGVFEDRSHHYPSRIAADVPAAVAAMEKALGDRGLAAADVFVQTGAEPPVAAANDPDGSVRGGNRELFRAMVAYARGIGAAHLTGLPGVLHEGIDPAADWDLAREEAAWRVAACKEEGIAYAVEPHVGSILPDPETTLRFLGEVPGLTLTLDYGHFLYQGMENERVHPLLPHASHFHARGGAPGQLQATVKDNRIDFAAAVSGLAEAGYEGFLCLEYVYVDWEGCNRTDNVSETLQLRELLQAAHRGRPGAPR